MRNPFSKKLPLPTGWKPKPLEEMTEAEIHRLYNGIMRGIAEYETTMTKWDKFTSRFFWRYVWRVQSRVRKAFHHRKK